MTSVFTARRRAEEFNSLVEDPSTGRAPDTRFADLVDVIAQLRALEPPAPRAEFTASLRAELMTAADTLLAPSDDAARLALPPRRARDRRMAVAVGGLAIVGATTSLAVAAQSALPGEMLYPLKRAMENAETRAHVSDEARAASLLADATTRLDEATQLSRGGDLGDAPSIATSFTDFADQAREASRLVLADYAATGDESGVERLNDFTATSMDTLTVLEGLVPGDARDELLRAARVLEQIDAEADRACPSCTGGIDQIPSILLASGAASQSTVVVVPGTVLPATSSRIRRNHDDGAGTGDVTDVTEPLADTDVTTTPTEDTTGTTGSDDDQSGPLEQLTGDLTGTTGGTTTDNGGLTDDLSDLDGTVDDVTGGLDDTISDLP